MSPKSEVSSKERQKEVTPPEEEEAPWNGDRGWSDPALAGESRQPLEQEEVGGILVPASEGSEALLTSWSWPSDTDFSPLDPRTMRESVFVVLIHPNLWSFVTEPGDCLSSEIRDGKFEWWGVTLEVLRQAQQIKNLLSGATWTFNDGGDFTSSYLPHWLPPKTLMMCLRCPSLCKDSVQLKYTELIEEQCSSLRLAYASWSRDIGKPRAQHLQTWFPALQNDVYWKWQSCSWLLVFHCYISYLW